MKLVSEPPKDGQFVSIAYDSDGELVATTFRIEDGLLLVLWDNEWCEWGPVDEFVFGTVEEKYVINEG